MVPFASASPNVAHVEGEHVVNVDGELRALSGKSRAGVFLIAKLVSLIAYKGDPLSTICRNGSVFHGIVAATPSRFRSRSVDEAGSIPYVWQLYPSPAKNVHQS
jgi:hypothetical protein